MFISQSSIKLLRFYVLQEAVMLILSRLLGSELEARAAQDQSTIR
jgi:hypothetical protein